MKRIFELIRKLDRREPRELDLKRMKDCIANIKKRRK